MKNEMTILVNSCDRYCDIWDVYFEMLYKKWPDCPYKIMLNTESLSYQNKHFAIQVINLPKGVDLQSVSWSERLIMCLEQIQSKYILFTLDDIYFLKKIENPDVEELLSTVNKIDRFAMLYFYNHGPKYYKRKLGVYLCHRYCDFNYNITCNLWKKDELQKVLEPGETAWQAEQTIKKNAESSKTRYYCVGEDRIFNFNVSKYGLIGGKWAKATFELFEENGVAFLNTSNRELYNSGGNSHQIENEQKWQKHLQELEKYGKLPYFVYTVKQWRKWMPPGVRRTLGALKRRLMKK